MGTAKSCHRYALLDAIRGLAVLNMVLFHFFFDWFVLSGMDPAWYQKPAVAIWQQGICQTFIFVSGMTWALGHRHFRHGLILNLLGAGITAVTFFLMPEQTVWFGILTFLGCACLLWIPLDKLFSKIPAFPGLLSCYFLFLLTKHLPAGYVGMGNFQLCLPSFLYECKAFAALGFPFEGFTSGDYFPLFPWLFLYAAGYFALGMLKKSAGMKHLFEKHIPVLTGTGQHSLVIYIFHQPLCLAVCAVLLWMKGEFTNAFFFL